MYLGIYVNVNLLEKGIYMSAIPFLYSEQETIENLIERGEELQKRFGLNYPSDKYFENLKRCELVTVSLTKH